MELRKSTMLSAMVAMAGILAEINFHEAMSKSVEGIVISMVLAALVLVSVYFVIDGISAMCLAARKYELEKEEKQQFDEEEYRNRLYGIMGEILRFQKSVYSEINTLKNAGNTDKDAAIAELPGNVEALREEVSNIPADMSSLRESILDIPNDVSELRNDISAIPDGVNALRDELSGIPDGVNALRAELASVPEGVSALREELLEISKELTKLREQLCDNSDSEEETKIITEEDLKELEKSINDNSMKTAKVIAKYIMQSNEEMKDMLERRGYRKPKPVKKN